ncbi:hypothetical protein Tco_1194658 [Tanacetum coccineum]
MLYEGLILERQKTKEEMERMIAKAILQERRNIQAKISSQIQKAIDIHIPSQVDAVLEGLKSYNNDVKYGYIQRDLTDDEIEYLRLFEEEIDRNQMRRWEIYVNGRPLGPRRERPE